MNLHTFKDVVTSKRDALANDVEEDDDEDEITRGNADSVDGEEDEGADKVSIF
jgi:hypothetical protein